MADELIKKNRTLIVETAGTGHRFYYVRLLVEAALQRGDRVALGLTESSFAQSEYGLHLEKYENQVSIIYVDSINLNSVEIASRKFNADLTIVPDGDIPSRQLLMKRKWSGSGSLTLLIMREHSQRTRNFLQSWGINGFKKILFHYVSRKARVRLVILKSSIWNGNSQLPIARDPVTSYATSESIQEIRLTWQLDAKLHWFGVFGNIDRRKNLDIIAQSLNQIGRADLGILIAGQCQEGVLEEANPYLEMLRKRGIRVVIVNRMLSDTEMDSAVAAVDTAVLAHSNESPSGIMGKAVSFGTHVVASGAKALKDDAGMIPQNAIWCPLDINEMVRTFQISIERSGSVKPLKGLGVEQFTDELLLVTH